MKTKEAMKALQGKTMAELTADEKNAVSHRFHALEHLSAKLTGEE